MRAEKVRSGSGTSGPMWNRTSNLEARLIELDMGHWQRDTKRAGYGDIL
jgi:hypothetical protein